MESKHSNGASGSGLGGAPGERGPSGTVGVGGSVLRALRLAAGALALLAGGAAVTRLRPPTSASRNRRRTPSAACPAGASRAGGGKKPQVTFKSAPTGVNLKKGEQQLKPTNPSASMNAAQRDERRQRMAQKSRQLLVTEIQGLESSLPVDAQVLAGPSQADAAPRRGLRRARVGGLPRQDRGRHEGRRGQGQEPRASRRLQGRGGQGGSASSMPRARPPSSTTPTLKGQYPKWCLNSAADPAKSTGCGDEVLYYLAYEYEQAGPASLDDARKVYLELIQNWPSSPVHPQRVPRLRRALLQRSAG